jgi:glucan phosphoethanolaminetransferase (alkaline phosphatase superfamily)
MHGQMEMKELTLRIERILFLLALLLVFLAALFLLPALLLLGLACSGLLALCARSATHFYGLVFEMQAVYMLKNEVYNL